MPLLREAFLTKIWSICIQFFKSLAPGFQIFSGWRLPWHTGSKFLVVAGRAAAGPGPRLPSPQWTVSPPTTASGAATDCPPSCPWTVRPVWGARGQGWVSPPSCRPPAPRPSMRRPWPTGHLGGGGGYRPPPRPPPLVLTTTTAEIGPLPSAVILRQPPRLEHSTSPRPCSPASSPVNSVIQWERAARWRRARWRAARWRRAEHPVPRLRSENTTVSYQSFISSLHTSLLGKYKVLFSKKHWGIFKKVFFFLYLASKQWPCLLIQIWYQVNFWIIALYIIISPNQFYKVLPLSVHLSLSFIYLVKR